MHSLWKQFTISDFTFYFYLIIFSSKALCGTGRTKHMNLSLWMNYEVYYHSWHSCFKYISVEGSRRPRYLNGGKRRASEWTRRWRILPRVSWLDYLHFSHSVWTQYCCCFHSIITTGLLGVWLAKTVSTCPNIQKHQIKSSNHQKRRKILNILLKRSSKSDKEV